MELKTFDLRAIEKASPDERKAVGEEIAHYFRKQGFIKVIPELPDKIVEVAFSWNRQFFQLPVETKQRAAHPPLPNPHRGWSKLGAEVLSKVSGYGKGIEVPEKVLSDTKEHFDQGPANDTLYPNVWPSEEDFPGFRRFMESFFDHCFSIQMRILSLLALGLGYPEDFFDKLHKLRENELRIIHYPEIDISELHGGDRTRVAEHSDFGTLTLLWQDSVGGLEIEDQNNLGTFLPIESKDFTECLVNIGDCFQQWTNGKLRSVNHRVHIPHKDLDKTTGTLPERYSIAYFAKPNRHESVRPLLKFLGEKRADEYPEMTAWEFNQVRLSRTY